MSIPFLPAPLIIPTFNYLQVPELQNSEGIKLEKLKKYFNRRWINRISQEELFINDFNIATNNGAKVITQNLNQIYVQVIQGYRVLCEF